MLPCVSLSYGPRGGAVSHVWVSCWRPPSSVYKTYIVGAWPMMIKDTVIQSWSWRGGVEVEIGLCVRPRGSRLAEVGFVPRQSPLSTLHPPRHDQDRELDPQELSSLSSTGRKGRAGQGGMVHVGGGNNEPTVSKVNSTEVSR